MDDVTLLAALIQCEAGNECYEGQLAVGAVVMNRVRSGRYAGSIYGVIYQAGQFPPAGRGSVASIAANGPKSSCIQAAQEAINGADNTGGATCFSRASRGRGCGNRKPRILLNRYHGRAVGNDKTFPTAFLVFSNQI